MPPTPHTLADPCNRSRRPHPAPPLPRQHLQPRLHPRPWSPMRMSLVQVLFTATPSRGLVPCAGWPPPPSYPICRNRSGQTISSPFDAPPRPRPRLSFCLPSVLPLRSCRTTSPLPMAFSPERKEHHAFKPPFQSQSLAQHIRRPRHDPIGTRRAVSTLTSIHSASSYTAAGFSWKESAIHPEGRARASSSTSDFGDALAPPIVGIDRRTSRSVVGSPLAQASHFFATASRSPDASIRSRSSISTRPTTAPEGSVTRQSSGFSRATEPFPAGQDFGMGDSDDHGTASPRGKRMATASMRGVPGSPTKKSASIASPTAAHATFSSTPVAAESPTVTAPDVRKHTKNKSSSSQACAG